MEAVSESIAPVFTSLYVEDLMMRSDLTYFAERILDIEIADHHKSWSKLVAKNDRLAITAARDHGKTTALRHTLVLRHDGTLARFDGLKVGDRVLALGACGKNRVRKVEWVQKCGVKKCVKITTQTGREIVAALTHPFLRMDRWAKTLDLKVGERIAVPRRIDLDLPGIDVSNAELKLLGHVIANGSLTTQFGITSEKYKQDVQDCLDTLGFKYSISSSRSHFLISKKHAAFLTKYGLAGKSSLEKSIPDQVFKLSNVQLRVFLSRLWVDGNVTFVRRDYRGCKGQVSIELCMGSELLVRQVQHLLLRLGIVSHFAEKKLTYRKKDGSMARAWRVSVTGKANQLSWLDQLGELFAATTAVARAFLGSVEANSQNDQIPNGWQKLSRTGSAYPYEIGRAKLQRLANAESNSALLLLAHSDVLWDKIVSISDAGEEECWDIQVAEDANYIANDIYSHNSFFFSFALPIWRAYYNWVPRPIGVEFRSIPRTALGYIFSATQSQAVALLEIIKGEIETNPKLVHLMPKQRESWSKTEIRLSNGCIIRARGWGVRVRGGHPAWVVCDDTLNDETIYSEMIRKKQIEYFYGAVTPMLVPGGQLIVVGTPFHREDLYNNLAENIAYRFRTFPALKKTGEALWPTRYSKEALQKKKVEVGSIRFSREYLVIPVSDESSLFPERILTPCFDPQHEMPASLTKEDHRSLQVFTGIDLAMSATVGADYTVITTIGVDQYKNRWLLDIRRKKGLSMSEQLREIENVYKLYKPLKMLIEDNSFQRVFRDELVRNTDLPIEGFTTTAHAKNALERGVPSLQILFENRKFVIPRKTERDRQLTDLLVNELKCFTWQDGKLQGVGAHDDMVMSLWISVEASNSYEFSFGFA